MTPMILDGTKIANEIEKEIHAEINPLRGRRPLLAVLLTTDDPASKIYVERKRQACNRVGIEFEIYKGGDSEEGLIRQVSFLSDRPGVDGVVVQLPLPNGFDRYKVFDALNPTKDVDCFSPANVGLLVQGRPRYLPPTPSAVQQLLVRNGIALNGKNVCIINRSEVVGKPLQAMLVQDHGEQANATVVLCHDRTPRHRLLDACLNSDIIVVAVGIPNFITVDMVREGVVIVDVGINRLPGGKVVGDVDYANVAPICSAISPVPGGVGPLTVANLLLNTVKAYRQNREVWLQYITAIHHPEKTYNDRG